MNNNHYEDPVLARIRDLLEQQGPRELKGCYYLGEPLTVAKSELPIGFIEYRSQSIFDSSSFEIETRALVRITVAIDLTRDINGLTKQMKSHGTLNRYICGRDSKFRLLEDSILGVIMKNQDASLNGERLAFNIGDGVNISYDLAQLGEDVFARTASLEFWVSCRQNV